MQQNLTATVWSQCQHADFAPTLQFAHLQQDYEYNLELLDGRDAELERYDKEFDAIRQELVAHDGLISQLHARLGKAESGTCLLSGQAFGSQSLLMPEVPFCCLCSFAA